MRYSKELDKYVREHNVIPYRLHIHSRYRNNCFYWSDYWGKWFKVLEVEYDFSYVHPVLIGAYVKWSDGGYGYISTDLTTDDYRIELDKYSIKDQNIINSSESFSGAEIEYWLFLHGIDDKDGKYRRFRKFISRHSDMRLEHTKFYYITANVNSKGNYSNTAAQRDKRKQKFPKINKEENKSHEM